MNNNENRWWIAGVLGLILGLAIALSIAQTPFAEGGAGLVGLMVMAVLLIALLLVIAAVWPGFTRRTQAGLERSPGKTFLIGLLNYVFLGAIVLLLLNSGPLAAVGMALGAVLLAGTFLGLPAVAALVGARLHALRERETTRWAEIVSGGLGLYLAGLVPFVGWFLLLPALCLWSFGAAALALVSRQKVQPKETQSYTEEA